MMSANAGYCLGMMDYYGKGTKQEKSKGLKLLKKSFENGVFGGNISAQVKNTLPDGQLYRYILSQAGLAII